MTVRALSEVDLTRSRRVVLVAVDELDLRAQVALRYALLIPARAYRAVHVDLDEGATRSLGLEWMQSGVRMPLDILDDRGGVAASIAGAARRCVAPDIDEVVVLVGSLAVRGLSRRLFHDRTADEISHAVNRVPRALSVLLPVAGASR